MSSNFERLQKILNQAYAENFSFLLRSSDLKTNFWQYLTRLQNLFPYLLFKCIFFFKTCFKRLKLQNPIGILQPQQQRRRVARRGAISATRFGSSSIAAGYSGAAAATSAVKAEKKRKAGCCSSLHGGVTGNGPRRGGLRLVQPQPLLAFTVLESPNRPLDEHSLQPLLLSHFQCAVIVLLPHFYSVLPPHAFKAFCRS